jgi:hypothetical protein
MRKLKGTQSRLRKLDGSNPLVIEVLIRKASVDPDFRKLVLEKRADAAKEIGLELSPDVAATINSVPAELLDKIIAATKVTDEDRREFLGRMGLRML